MRTTLLLLAGLLVTLPSLASGADIRICNVYTGNCPAADAETSPDQTYEDIVQQMQARQRARLAQHATEQHIRAERAMEQRAQSQQRARERYLDAVEAGMISPFADVPLPAFVPLPPLPPPRPPDQSFILRTPSGALYWGVGSTIWGPDGSYTVY